MRFKDIWMVRTAVERLIQSKLPKETAMKLAPMAECLHDALRIYQESRKQVWQDLGLDKPTPAWKFWINRRVLVEQFNDRVAELAEEEVTLPPAVPVKTLHGLTLSAVDLIALKNLGALRG